MELDEIPREIRQRMRTKWNNAYMEGWNDNLWQGCALCEIIGQGCPTACPLVPGGWCMKWSRMSKLSIRYNDGGLLRHEALAAWQERVKEFVKMVDESLERT